MDDEYHAGERRLPGSAGADRIKLPLMRSDFLRPLVGTIVLFSGGASLGCSSDDAPASPMTDSGRDGGASVSGEGGTQSCETLLQSAAALLVAEDEAIAANQSCSRDDDCVLLDNSWSCKAGCGAVVDTGGVSAVQAALLSASSSAACTEFLAQGCVPEVPPCYSAGPAAQCVGGQCRAGFPDSGADGG